MPPDLYKELRTSTARVIASVSVVQSDEPWAFFAVKGTQWGAPRWVYFNTPATSPLVDLEAIAGNLRQRLETRERRALDERAVETLEWVLACSGAGRAPTPS